MACKHSITEPPTHHIVIRTHPNFVKIQIEVEEVEHRVFTERCRIIALQPATQTGRTVFVELNGNNGEKLGIV